MTTFAHPLAALFCVVCLYVAHWANNRRRMAERELAARDENSTWLRAMEMGE